ncbi:MAG: 3-hydroxyacyl-CoA dehydrogenase/enoyl-CoA hydratase family protein, partial [Deltaproteobacteria bacterium]
MGYRIKKVAVLGSGIMGRGIAGHLAGCGLDVLLLDIVPFDEMLSEEERKRKATDPAVRNKLVLEALKAAKKAKPPASALYHAQDAERIEVGNFEDDFEKIAGCDWVIEVVVERMDVKKDILARVDRHRRPGSIVSTNTSGLSIVGMSEGRSEDFLSHFLGTHFFNPVRFMKLLEIIPHPKTDPDLLHFMEVFATDILGKGVIRAKDTPNFIANRIGVHGMMTTMKLMVEEGLRIDEVDTIAGPPMGRPKSAIFKTADLVGIDTLAHVAKTVYDACPDDEAREIFEIPPFVERMIAEKKLGKKTGEGFYKRGPKKEKLVLDYRTFEYVPVEKPSFESLEAAKAVKHDPARSLAALVEGEDKAARFAWKLLRESLCYAARRIPEIADRIDDIDRGMRLGFNFKLGPFESWDAIGVRKSVERMKAEGCKVPENVEKMLAAGNESFYREEEGRRFQYDLVEQRYVEVPRDEKVIRFADLPTSRKVEENDGATIWDLGEGCACLEFHTKMNAVDSDIVAMQNRLVDLLEAGRFEAAVVANDAENFSVGANIFLILMAITNEAFDQIEEMVRAFQQANMRMKYAPRPIVVAPAGMALGGGCEVVMHGQRVVGAAESYIGLVEVGVGLIPGGGGVKEMVLRSTEGILPGTEVPILPFARRAFENIGMAKVASSFREAQDLGLLRRTDIMVTNRDHLIDRAKRVALAMAAEGFDPGRPRTDIPVAGESGKAAFL